MGEKRIGLIPHATTMMRGGTENVDVCSLMVTDRRIIFAFRAPRGSVKDAFKNLFRKEDAPGQPELAKVDFATVDLDQLASMNDNVSVSYSTIEKFSLGKQIGGYVLWIEYLDRDGKKLFAMANLTPSEDLIAERRAQGIRPKEARRRYALRCGELLRKSIPPLTAEKGAWKIE